MSSSKVIQLQPFIDKRDGDVAWIQQDPIGKNKDPWAFLSVTGLHEGHQAEVEKVINLFNLSTKQGLGNARHFFIASKDMNTREKSAILFYAGLCLLNNLEGLSILVGQFDVLAFRLSNGDRSIESSALFEEDSESFKDWDPHLNELVLAEQNYAYLQCLGMLGFNHTYTKGHQLSDFLKQNFSSSVKKQNLIIAG